MNGLSPNEMIVLLKIFKDFNSYHNANKLSKEMGLSAMGALKILKNLEKQNLIKYEMVGKAKIYKINFNNNYAKEYVAFLLRKEAEDSKPRIKRWVAELRKLEPYSQIGMVFGSVLKSDQHNDVDLLAVLKQLQVKEFNKKIDELNQINVKRIHPVKQTLQDLKNNLVKKDKIVLSAIRDCIVLFGYDKIVEVVESVSR
jgi:DNA-binding Lrp family transcriptional regulator